MNQFIRTICMEAFTKYWIILYTKFEVDFGTRLDIFNTSRCREVEVELSSIRREEIKQTINYKYIYIYIFMVGIYKRVYIRDKSVCI